MKLLALVFVVAAAAAAPQIDNQKQYDSSGQPEVRIVSRTFEQDQDGNYEYAYKLSNDQEAQEIGRVQPGLEPETGSIEKQGFYGYVDNEGNTHRVEFTSGKGGYKAQSADLPQKPAQIPAYDQLRLDQPELFWAENGGVINNQQVIVPLDDIEAVDYSQYADRSDWSLPPLRAPGFSLV